MYFGSQILSSIKIPVSFDILGTDTGAGKRFRQIGYTNNVPLVPCIERD